mmetsp:Transcript_9410/g.31485  ORF Transcript_9410/g.31485 Transcript_9410/m.31485 type:complete len:112 (+) Transcript_9410:699-1034(+)
MHFTGAVGPTDYPDLASRIDKIDGRIAALENRPKPSEAVQPIKEKIRELEARLDDLTSPEGLVTAKNEMAEMEKRLSELESEYEYSRFASITSDVTISFLEQIRRRWRREQ